MKHSAPIISMVEKKDSTLLFEIQTMEYIDEHRHNRIEKPHKHDYFTIIWIQKGSGIHTVDFIDFPIENNSIYFITPGQIHHVETDSMPEGVVISFHQDFFCITENHREILMNAGLFYSCSQFNPQKVSDQQAVVLNTLVKLLVTEFATQEYMHYESLRALLKLFLINSSRFWGNMQNNTAVHSKPAQITRQFLNLLENQYRTHTKVSDFASQLAITPSHLNDTIRNTTGLAASDHIKNRVILEAKRMAAIKDASAKEVAYHLGFDDEAHFSKYFKNNSGFTFTEFKKSVTGGRTQCFLPRASCFLILTISHPL
jgi:AraC family transcriptional regulator, transcriptional activator of pobA